MKKLSKISLLGDVSLLSKKELQQLFGSSSNGTVSCESATNAEECSQRYGTCTAGNNNGTCVYSPIGCICDPGPYGG